MPSGSATCMSQKSAYATSSLFAIVPLSIFCQKKPPGKVILILSGHSSYCNSVEMLKLAAKNKLHLVCHPNHANNICSHWT